MKISFLVTYYQQERFVQESIDSILALEKPWDWEILAGDDGSSDRTTEIIQSYIDKDPEHIRLYIMDREPDRKYMSVDRASMNRLNLLEHATGDCYCLMDGDDFYCARDFVPEAISVLELHPNVSIVGFDTRIWQEGDPKIQGHNKATKPILTSKKIYLHWQYTHAGACIIRKNPSLANLEKLKKIRSFDDNDIVLNALANGEMIRIHRPIYAYRQEEGSVYNAMNPAEKAALNVSGMGASLQIMGPEWKKDVTFRFATAIWMAWFLRKDLPDMLNPAKYRYYLECCERTDFSLGEQLLRWPKLNRNDQQKIRRWVYRTGINNPLRVIYAWLQTHKRRRSSF